MLQEMRRNSQGLKTKRQIPISLLNPLKPMSPQLNPFLQAHQCAALILDQCTMHGHQTTNVSSADWDGVALRRGGEQQKEAHGEGHGTARQVQPPDGWQRWASNPPQPNASTQTRRRGNINPKNVAQKCLKRKQKTGDAHPAVPAPCGTHFMALRVHCVAPRDTVCSAWSPQTWFQMM